MNFVWISHLDTFAVVARLHKHSRELGEGIQARHEGTPQVPQRSLLLRGPADRSDPEKWLTLQPLLDTPLYTEWKSLRATVDRMVKAVQARDDFGKLIDFATPLGRVMISELPARKVMVWHRDSGPYNDRHLRFHLALITNPGAICYSAHETMHMPVGSVWFFNNKTDHCVANWGATPRWHLIVDMPLRQPAEEGE